MSFPTTIETCAQRGLDRPSRPLRAVVRLFVWSLCSFAWWAFNANAQAADVFGSGSTFIYPVMLRWAAGYNAKTGARINYQAVGSGSGIQQVKAGQVTFGASDRPLPSAELKAAGLAQFPLVIGGVVPVVNLGGVKSGELRLTGELLADIYLGKVTTWDDPAIAALNPGLKLPYLRITVTHRSDSSGTTFNWVNYLSKCSAEWKSRVGEGTMVTWPLGTAGGGNEGVARYVNFIKGSIGYVELSYAIDNHMNVAQVRNQNGMFVAPSMESFQAAAASADWSAPDFYTVLTNAPGDTSWPITATTYILMPRAAQDPQRSAQAVRFFRWSLEQGQGDARTLHYVALPDTLVRQIEAYWTENLK